MDAQLERRNKQADIDLDRLTVGVNAGTVISYDRLALARWQARHRGAKAQTSDQFSATVSRLATLFPTKVQKPN